MRKFYTLVLYTGASEASMLVGCSFMGSLTFGFARFHEFGESFFLMDVWRQTQGMSLSDPATLPILWGYGYCLVKLSFHLYYPIWAVCGWGDFRDRAFGFLPDQISCLK